MDDWLNLPPPSMLEQITTATQNIGFGMASDHLTGSLLRTLAASKANGAFLELGTGTGISTAWILDGMNANSTALFWLLRTIEQFIFFSLRQKLSIVLTILFAMGSVLYFLIFMISL